MTATVSTAAEHVIRAVGMDCRESAVHRVLQRLGFDRGSKKGGDANATPFPAALPGAEAQSTIRSSTEEQLPRARARAALGSKNSSAGEQNTNVLASIISRGDLSAAEMSAVLAGEIPARFRVHEDED